MGQWRRLVGGFVLLVGTAASLLAYRSAEQTAQALSRLRVEPAADQFAEQFRDYVAAQALAGTAFAGLLSVAPNTGQREFEMFGERVAPSYPGLVAVNWFPRTPPDRLAQVEKALAAAGAPHPYVRDAEGRRLSGAVGRDLFPVLLTTPPLANQTLLGFDVASSPARRPALEHARDTGATVASEPVELVQLPGVRGTNLYVPVYRGRPTDTASRRDALTGYVSVAFRLDLLVHDALPQAPRLFRVHLFDVDAPPGRRLLASIGPDAGGGGGEALLADAHLERRGLSWGHRRWELVFEPVAGAGDEAGSAGPAVLGLGLLLSLALAAYVFSQDRAGRELARANARLTEALAAREMLFKETHHRIKNNLQVVSSLLQMQAAKSADPQVRGVLQETQGRIQSIGLLHNILYTTDDVSSVDLRSYLQRLIHVLAQGYGAEERGIAIRLELEPVSVTMERAVPVGLVVTEVVTNAFKHAFPPGWTGEVCVSIRQHDSDFQIVVKDTGAGMPEQTAAPGGLGQTIIRAMVAQLDGQFTIARDGGTVFRMIIPAEAA